MRNIRKLRIINGIGAAGFAVYGALIAAWPVAALNAFILIIDIWYLAKMRNDDEKFDFLEVDGLKSPYVRKFIDFHLEDILNFQETFNPEDRGGVKGCLILRDVRPVSIVPLPPNRTGNRGNPPGLLGPQPSRLRQRPVLLRLRPAQSNAARSVPLNLRRRQPHPPKLPGKSRLPPGRRSRGGQRRQGTVSAERTPEKLPIIFFFLGAPPGPSARDRAIRGFRVSGRRRKHRLRRPFYPWRALKALTGLRTSRSSNSSTPRQPLKSDKNSQSCIKNSA